MYLVTHPGTYVTVLNVCVLVLFIFHVLSLFILSNRLSCCSLFVSLISTKSDPSQLYCNKSLAIQFALLVKHDIFNHIVVNTTCRQPYKDYMVIIMSILNFWFN